ncbi:MAG: PHP domain-containing protein [Fretibacterium sp.]|nr:PHP domain-containing protein [Fretibacterium sp.]
MILDMHLHTCEHSPDSFMSVREAVLRAKEIGLDGLCVTDHDSMGLAAEVEPLRRECDFPLFVGIEVLTTGGDFVVVGLDRAPDRILTSAELMDLVARCDAVAVAAHPFRDNGRGAGDLILELPGLTGVECFNGSTKPQENLRAWELAGQLGLAQLGGSDAHHVERLGRFATRFDGVVRDERDLVRLIRARACEPLAWNGTSFVPAPSWERGKLEAEGS